MNIRVFKTAIASVLVVVSTTACAHGPYYPPAYPVYPPVHYGYGHGGVGHIYGAAVVGGIVGAVVNNALTPRPVVVVPQQQPVYIQREQWIYDPSCDCQRRAIVRSPY